MSMSVKANRKTIENSVMFEIGSFIQLAEHWCAATELVIWVCMGFIFVHLLGLSYASPDLGFILAGLNLTCNALGAWHLVHAFTLFPSMVCVVPLLRLFVFKTRIHVGPRFFECLYVSFLMVASASIILDALHPVMYCCSLSSVILVG
jgi:hypothetical protein